MKKREKHSARQNLGFMLKHLWKNSPVHVILAFASTVFSSFIDIIISVFMFRYIINGIQTGKSFGNLLLVVTLTMLAVFLMLAFMDWYQNVYLPRADLKLTRYFDKIIFQKAKEIDLESYDNMEFFNKYSRAIKETNSRATAVLSDFSRLVSSAIALFSLVTILVTMDPILIAFSILPILFSLPLSFLRNKLNFRYNRDITLDNRKQDYYRQVLKEKEYAKEIRMTKISEVLNHQYDKSVNNLSGILKKYSLKRFGIGVWETFNQIAIVMYTTYIYLIYRITVSKSLLIGDFVSLYNAVRTAEYSLRNIIEIVPKMNEHSMFIENLREFLQLESHMRRPEKPLPLPDEKEFSLQNVFFQYQSDESMILNDISFRIANKQKIAIVGRNGAGKSTLIKNIMRLYEPKEGQIQLGGVGYDNYDLDEYRDLFATVFQDFKLYRASVGENILMAKINGEDDEHKVIEILKKVGLYEKVAAAKNGIHTDVSKEFCEDGIVFSGGEEQKLAIARAFVHSNSVLIFDEASSALDPISEYEINNLILSMAEDKTVILISPLIYY